MTALFTRAWWTAAGHRVLATVLVALAGVITPVLTGTMTPLAAVSMVTLTALAALATALAGLPEVTDKAVSVWRAILARTARTLGQSVAAGLGTAVLLTDVDWRALGVAVASATALTLIRTVLMRLPETATSGLDIPPEA